MPSGGSGPGGGKPPGKGLGRRFPSDKPLVERPANNSRTPGTDIPHQLPIHYSGGLTTQSRDAGRAPIPGTTPFDRRNNRTLVGLQPLQHRLPGGPDMPFALPRVPPTSTPARPSSGTTTGEHGFTSDSQTHSAATQASSGLQATQAGLRIWVLVRHAVLERHQACQHRLGVEMAEKHQMAGHQIFHSHYLCLVIYSLQRTGQQTSSGRLIQWVQVHQDVQPNTKSPKSPIGQPESRLPRAPSLPSLPGLPEALA